MTRNEKFEMQINGLAKIIFDLEERLEKLEQEKRDREKKEKENKKGFDF